MFNNANHKEVTKYETWGHTLSHVKMHQEEVDTLSPIYEQGAKIHKQKSFKTKCLYRSFFIWNMYSKFGVNKFYMKTSIIDGVEIWLSRLQLTVLLW